MHATTLPGRQSPFAAGRRFTPLFVTQFLGAFNDNLFKTALLFLITFRAGLGSQASATMVSAAAGVFILPFLLFSGIAGRLADAVDKARIARAVKLAEFVILGVGGVGLMLANVPLLFAALFLMGVHSTVFGPVKYAILPQHLSRGSLIAGTGLIEGMTFVAILLGQIAGGLLPTPYAAMAMLVASAGGILASRLIPPAPPAAGAAPPDYNPWRSSVGILREAAAVRPVRLATIAIAWFWALGTIYTAEFVPLVHTALAASERVATLFLVIFTVGVAVGAGSVARLLDGRISARAAAPAVIAMAAAGVALCLAVGRGHAFAVDPRGVMIVLALFVLAVAGGVFSVPLYGILQTAPEAGTRAGAIAANNIVSAAWQVGGTLIAGGLIAAGLSVPLVLALSGVSGLALIPLLRKLS